MKAHQHIVFPLDNITSEQQAWKWCFDLDGCVGVMKVGLELFTRLGPRAVSIGKNNHQFKVFLDLKLHDIPNTVKGATQAAVDSGADFISIHASGGSAMIKAALDVAGATKILAITALTSLEKEDLRRIYGMSEPKDVVWNLAKIAYEAGARGFVCSPKEVKILRELYPDATLVVPGIRPAGAEVHDQRRVGTPADTMEAGADFIVVGRPIRNASDPKAAAMVIAQEISEGLQRRAGS